MHKGTLRQRAVCGRHRGRTQPRRPAPRRSAARRGRHLNPSRVVGSSRASPRGHRTRRRARPPVHTACDTGSDAARPARAAPAPVPRRARPASTPSRSSECLPPPAPPRPAPPCSGGEMGGGVGRLHAPPTPGRCRLHGCSNFFFAPQWPRRKFRNMVNTKDSVAGGRPTEETGRCRRRLAPRLPHCRAPSAPATPPCGGAPDSGPRTARAPLPVASESLPDGNAGPEPLPYESAGMASCKADPGGIGLTRLRGTGAWRSSH